MTTTTAADLRRVLRYAESTVEVGDFTAVGSVLLRGLTELVGADEAVLQEIDLSAGPRVVVVGWPARRFTLAHAEQYASLLATHPLVGKCTEQPPGQCLSLPPVRVSDLRSRRQWRADPIHRTGCALDEEMNVVVSAHGPALRGIWLGRNGRSFTERERDLLALTRRHLAAALRRARRDRHRGLQLLPRPAWVPLDRPGRAASTPAPPHEAGDPAARGPAGGNPLSNRERQVLALVARGLTDAALARQLGISPRTAGKHLERTYTKLGLPNRAAAAAWWSTRPGHDAAPHPDAPR